MESGLTGISKIFLVEIIAKHVQQSFAIDGVEPWYRAEDRNTGKMLDGTFVIFVAVADHRNALDGHFCTAQGPDGEQSMVDRSQRRSRCNQNGICKMACEIEHQLRIVDGNENAASAFGNDWPGEIVLRLNAREIDPDSACFRCELRRDRRIEAIRLRNGLRFGNFRQLHHGAAIGAFTCASLNGLPVRGIEGGDKERGKQRFADVCIRAGDKERLFHGRTACTGTCSCSRMETSASVKRASRSVESFALSEIRKREVPAGTLGGRMGRTPNPASLRSAANRTVRSLSPRKIGTICVSPRPISKPASRNLFRRKAARAARSFRSRSDAATMRIAARICTVMRIRSARPDAATKPLPCGPATPVAWASSMMS